MLSVQRGSWSGSLSRMNFNLPRSYAHGNLDSVILEPNVYKNLNNYVFKGVVFKTIHWKLKIAVNLFFPITSISYVSNYSQKIRRILKFGCYMDNISKQNSTMNCAIYGDATM
jgi:hypothetical protein